jgi:hypothetical protein
LGQLSEAQDRLPSSLFISGANDPDEHPTFAGGFGDVYQASYRGKKIALKRIRTFTTDSTSHRTRLVSFAIRYFGDTGRFYGRNFSEKP